MTCGSTTHEGAPPPPVVFYCELEVGEGYGDKGCDNDEDDEDNEEDGVDGVDLVAPHAGKDVVQLNVDGAEGQEACICIALLINALPNLAEQFMHSGSEPAIFLILQSC